MTDIVIAILATSGAVFTLLAAVGIVRMPDLYLRISVTTKAASLGIGLILFCTALYFKETSVTTKVLAIIFFIFLTAPVSAHLIGRAAYIIGVPLWVHTIVDHLEGKYDKNKNDELSSEE